MALTALASELGARLNPQVLFQKVTIIGVGLLGGSLGLALKRRRLAVQVAGYVRRSASVSECEQSGAVDLATRDLLQAVDGADLVVFCTPLGRMRELAETMLPSLKPGAVVTDVGSVKASVVRELEPLFSRAGLHFIGSHPMCGGEKMGVNAARAELFEGAFCVVTPTQNSNTDALKKVDQLWQEVGMRTLVMTPEQHDELVARSSHLPHVVAAELASYVLDPAHSDEQALLCGNGFRDTTRVASGSPEMWRDIALANRANLSRVLGVCIEDLEKFKLALDNADTKAIEDFFEKAKQRRDKWRSQASAN